MIDNSLTDALGHAGRNSERLVVGSDYDGTLSRLVDDPAQAVPNRDALGALAELGSLPGVSAVIISGRSQAVLADLTGAPAGIRLVGTHGAEGLDQAPTSDPEAVARLVAALADVQDAFEGTLLEPKPVGAALHYRHAADRDAAAAAARAAATAAGARIIEGKLVVEALLGSMDKGRAFAQICDRWSADQSVFIGDDQTDEHVFRVMAEGAVSIKVGPGQSAAHYRVETVDDVAECLALLVAARRLR